MQDTKFTSVERTVSRTAVPTVVYEEYDANDGQVTSGGTKFHDASEDLMTTIGLSSLSVPLFARISSYANYSVSHNFITGHAIRYKVIQNGGREAKLSQSMKKKIAEESLDVRVNYCEKSLTDVFMVHPKTTVSEVRAYARNQIVHRLATQYGITVTVDDELTDILPRPQSDSQEWGDLPKDTTIIMWPVKPPGDVPLKDVFSKDVQKETGVDKHEATTSKIVTCNSNKNVGKELIDYEDRFASLERELKKQANEIFELKSTMIKRDNEIAELKSRTAQLETIMIAQAKEISQRIVKDSAC